MASAGFRPADVTGVLTGRIAAATAVVCLVGCGSSGGSSGAAPRYPEEQVVCTSTTPGVDLRWHDLQLLSDRARALGLDVPKQTVSVMSIVGVGETSTSSIEQTFRQPDVGVIAEASPRLRQVCDSGPGVPTTTMKLFDDFVVYGPQPFAARAATDRAARNAVVATFIRRHYASHALLCTPIGGSVPPDSAYLSCTSRERTFQVRMDLTNRTFVVRPEVNWRR